MTFFTFGPWTKIYDFDFRDIINVIWYFIADNLIFHLELVSCGLGASKNHVHSLMTDLNIPVQKITDIYEK